METPRSETPKTPKSKLANLRVGNPGNQGNQRKTGRGYRNQKGGAHTVAWRDDRLFRSEIEPIVRLAWIQRRPASEILRVVNLALERQGQPAVGPSTIYEYVKRVQVLIKEEQAQTTDLQAAAIAALDAEIGELVQVRREAWKAWRADQDEGSNVSGINRDRLLQTIVSVTARWESLLLTRAKFDGSLEQGSRYGGSGEMPELPASPMEMLAQGLATPEQVQVWMHFTAKRAGVRLPAGEQVIDGQGSRVEMPAVSLEAATEDVVAEDQEDEGEGDGLDEIDVSDS